MLFIAMHYTLIGNCMWNSSDWNKYDLDQNIMLQYYSVKMLLHDNGASLCSLWWLSEDYFDINQERLIYCYLQLSSPGIQSEPLISTWHVNVSIMFLSEWCHRMQCVLRKINIWHSHISQGHCRVRLCINICPFM